MLLEVFCVNEFFDDHPSEYKVSLTIPLIRRIIQLRKGCHTLDVYKISEFFYSGEFSGSNSVEARVECPQLHVTRLGFFFTAIPKHLGSSERLETDFIYFTS